MDTPRETAFAKLNLALHVRGRRADGRHDIETIFAFCEDGDELTAEPAGEISLRMTGSFAEELGPSDNLVMRAASMLRERAGTEAGAALHLHKQLPVASGIGGGSADAAAALRLLTCLWDVPPEHAEEAAPILGSDVPACLLSLSARGEGAGDELQPVDTGVSGLPVLLVNPRVALSTAEVFARWDGEDRGPLSDWRSGRNDLEQAARQLVPQLDLVLAWLHAQTGVTFVRMSGSGATCFALFDSIDDRDRSADAVPREWWHLATRLR